MHHCSGFNTGIVCSSMCCVLHYYAMLYFILSRYPDYVMLCDIMTFYVLFC